MEQFRECLDMCALADMGYSGYPFTWDNRQQGRDNIKVRLDRAMVDETFMELFDNTGVQHIQTTESDHCALSIVIKKLTINRCPRVTRSNGQQIMINNKR